VRDIIYIYIRVYVCECSPKYLGLHISDLCLPAGMQGPEQIPDIIRYTIYSHTYKFIGGTYTNLRNQDNRIISLLRYIIDMLLS